MSNTKQAFTLIELLVVIAIVSIISATVITSLDGARSKARDAQRMSHIREIQQALEMFHIDNGVYPISNWRYSYNSDWESWLGAALEPYMPTMPVDPVNEATAAYSGGLSYAYYAIGNGGSGDWYVLIFTLENQNLPLVQKAGVTDCNSVLWNYGYGNGFTFTMGADCVQ